MHKSNTHRNGQAATPCQVKGISSVQWRLKDIRLACADKVLAFDDGHIYCVAVRGKSSNASFYAIDATLGEIAWSIDLNAVGIEDEKEVFTAPVISGRLAYFLSKPNNSRLHPILFGVDIIDQTIEFSTDIYSAMGEKYVEGTVHEYKRRLRTSVLVVENNIYLGTGNGCICSFEIETGKIEWTLDLSDEFAIGHLAYSDGYLYAQSGNRDLYAIDVSRKSIAWIFEHPEEYKIFLNWPDLCPLVYRNKVYVFGSLRNVYAVDKKTGKEIWKYGVRE